MGIVYMEITITAAVMTHHDRTGASHDTADKFPEERINGSSPTAGSAYRVN